jgi:hypothetical protein
LLGVGNFTPPAGTTALGVTGTAGKFPRAGFMGVPFGKVTPLGLTVTVAGSASGPRAPDVSEGAKFVPAGSVGFGTCKFGSGIVVEFGTGFIGVGALGTLPGAAITTGGVVVGNIVAGITGAGASA